MGTMSLPSATTQLFLAALEFEGHSPHSHVGLEQMHSFFLCLILILNKNCVVGRLSA